MAGPIDTITLRGFKSIKRLDEFPLSNVNILIGANGSGKSNFVGFFQMLRAMVDERFQTYVRSAGGGDGFLFLGTKNTPQTSGRLGFGDNEYGYVLQPEAGGSLFFEQEWLGYRGHRKVYSRNAWESALKSAKDDKSRWTEGASGMGWYVNQAVSGWVAYHFHDTGPLARVRRDQDLHDWETLRDDASNIAPFLLRMKGQSPECYERICRAVRMVAPFFDDFLFRPRTMGPNECVRLEWRQKGSDLPFQPYQLSDGTIRFACLATALLQPTLPSTIIFDEPELGLHPYAISLLASLIKSAATRTQIIAATQSPLLIDDFEPGDVVVVRRDQGCSTFERPAADDLKDWLEEYSLGELWQKNVIRGDPVHE